MRVEKKGSFFRYAFCSSFFVNIFIIINDLMCVLYKSGTYAKKGTFSLRYFTVFYEKMQ